MRYICRLKVCVSECFFLVSVPKWYLELPCLSIIGVNFMSMVNMLYTHIIFSSVMVAEYLPLKRDNVSNDMFMI